MASASSRAKSPAFRSSESTARLAFLWRILHRNEFTMHTAPSVTARTMGWSIPPRPTSSLTRTRFVDEVDRQRPGPQLPVAVLDLAGVGDHALDALRAEVVGRDDELAVRRHLAPVDDGDARELAAPRPLAVRAEERVEHVVPRRLRADLVAPEELAHHGEPEEDGRQQVVVGGGGRRLGVVLGKPEAAPLVDEEGVEPRDRARVVEPGIVADEGLFPVHEPKLREDGGVVEGRPVRLVERPEQQGRAGS